MRNYSPRYFTQRMRGGHQAWETFLIAGGGARTVAMLDATTLMPVIMTFSEEFIAQTP